MLATSSIMSPDDQTILDIFKYCQRAFMQYGVRLAFPLNTDPKKTYKWRYLVDFLVKMNELKLDIRTIYRVIDAIVKYADSHKQLRTRNLAILSSESIVAIAYNSISNDNKNEEIIYDSIEANHKFIKSVGTGNLLAREKGKISPNIIIWYMQGKICAAYIAISRSCQSAMLELSDTDKLILPSKLTLETIRRQCIESVDLKHRLKLLMGSDWGVIC